MTYPAASVGTITETAGSVVHNRPEMPHTVAAGDLLVAVAGFTSPFTEESFTSLPAGWGIKHCQPFTESAARHGTICLAIFEKVADGSEGGKFPLFNTVSQSYSAWVVHRITGWRAAVLGAVDATTRLVAVAPECPTDALALSRGAQDYLIMSTYARASSIWLKTMVPPPGYTMGKHAESLGGELQVATAFKQFQGSQIGPTEGSTPFWNNATSGGSYSWPTSEVQEAFSAVA